MGRIESGANSVGADADVTQVPTFDSPTVGGCYTAPSNAFKVITLDYRKSAGWVNLTSASTS